MNLDEAYVKKLEKEHAEIFARNQELECQVKTQEEYADRLIEVLERSVLLNRKALRYNHTFFDTPQPSTTQVEDDRCSNQFVKMLDVIYDKHKLLNSSGAIEDFSKFNKFLDKIKKEFWSE